jgi:hypothetical protein
VPSSERPAVPLTPPTQPDEITGWVQKKAPKQLKLLVTSGWQNRMFVCKAPGILSYVRERSERASEASAMLEVLACHCRPLPPAAARCRPRLPPVAAAASCRIIC